MADTFRCDRCTETFERSQEWDLYLCPPSIEDRYHAQLCGHCARYAVDELGFLIRNTLRDQLGRLKVWFHPGLIDTVERLFTREA